MKILLKILNIFFVTLGVIFFILLMIGLYLLVADPFDIKPLIFPAASSTAGAATSTPSSNPLISSEQKAALEKLGIDTAKLPSTISPAMETCFTEKLGTTRTNEIKQGSLISAIDLIKVQSCLK